MLPTHSLPTGQKFFCLYVVFLKNNFAKIKYKQFFKWLPKTLKNNYLKAEINLLIDC